MARIASARERIERTPAIASFEMAWYKGKFGELRPAATARKYKHVYHDSPLGSDRMFIHTHPKDETALDEYAREQEKKGILVIGVKTSPNDMPSLLDLHVFLSSHLAHSNVRTFVTVPMDEYGKTTGYIVLRARKELVSLTRSGSSSTRIRCKWLSMKPYGIRLEGKSEEINYRSLMQDLKRLGLKIRCVPMPGYRFVEDEFVKI